ncbi:MAG: hypothetical protein WCH59_04325 [Chitinophagia bacterium]|jgi:hypothetical protein
MNSIKSFSCQKIWLIITFISLVSCKKQAEISPNQTILKNENAFFYRGKVSPSANEKDLVDTIINFCKKGDSTAHFSNKIIGKYGYPQWDLALPISNANGLKSLFIPVVDTGSRVQLIIFAYQDSRKHVIFKFIDRNTEQTQLPKASADSRIFCKESLTGIFGALDKSVAAARIPKNSSMENIKSNGTYVTSLCWLISAVYEDGSVAVVNSQCSYQIIITPDNAGRKPGLANGLIGVYEDVQVGDGGGSSYQGSYQDMLNTILNSVNTDVDIISIEIIDITKDRVQFNYIQKFIEGGFPFGYWRYDSEDKVTSAFNKSKGVWEIQSIEHLSENKVGIQIGLQTDLVMKKINTFISPDKKSGTMVLDFRIDYTYEAGPIPVHHPENYSKTLKFNAYPF